MGEIRLNGVSYGGSSKITKESDYAFKHDDTDEYKAIIIERFGNVRTLSFRDQYLVKMQNGSICRSDGSGIGLLLDTKDRPSLLQVTGLIVYEASSSADSQLTAKFVYPTLCTISNNGSVMLRPIVNGAYGWHTDPSAHLLGSVTYMV